MGEMWGTLISRLVAYRLIQLLFWFVWFLGLFIYIFNLFIGSTTSENCQYLLRFSLPRAQHFHLSMETLICAQVQQETWTQVFIAF